MRKKKKILWKSSLFLCLKKRKSTLHLKENAQNAESIQTAVLRSLDKSALGVDYEKKIPLNIWAGTSREYLLEEYSHFLKEDDFASHWFVARDFLHDILSSPAPVVKAVDVQQKSSDILKMRLQLLEKMGAYKTIADITALINEDVIKEEELAPFIARIYLKMANYNKLCSFIRGGGVINLLPINVWGKLDLFCAIHKDEKEKADFSLSFLLDEGVISEKEAVLAGLALGYYEAEDELLHEIGELDDYLYHLASKGGLIKTETLNMSSDFATLWIETKDENAIEAYYYLYKKGAVKRHDVLQKWLQISINEQRFQQLMNSDLDEITVRDFAFLYKAFQEARLYHSKELILSKLLQYAMQEKAYFFYLHLFSKDIQELDITEISQDFLVHVLMVHLMEGHFDIYKDVKKNLQKPRNLLLFYEDIFITKMITETENENIAENIVDDATHDIFHKNVWLDLIHHTDNMYTKSQIIKLFLYMHKKYSVEITQEEWKKLAAFDKVHYTFEPGTILYGYIESLIAAHKKGEALIESFKYIKNVPKNIEADTLMHFITFWNRLEFQDYSRPLLLSYFDMFSLYPEFSKN